MAGLLGTEFPIHVITKESTLAFAHRRRKAVHIRMKVCVKQLLVCDRLKVGGSEFPVILRYVLKWLITADESACAMLS